MRNVIKNKWSKCQERVSWPDLGIRLGISSWTWTKVGMLEGMGVPGSGEKERKKWDKWNSKKINYILLIMLLQLSWFFLLCPPPPSTPYSLRQSSLLCSGPWVMGISSSATPFPILYFTSPWLFCNYLFVLLNPLTSSLIPLHHPPIWQPSKHYPYP